jgi:hypothetical protein
MGLRYNPFSGSFDFTRSPGSYLDGEVATFADLPLDTAAAPLNSAWLVREASGLYFLTRKPAGIYIRTATGGTDRSADYTYASAFPDVFSDANLVVYSDADSSKNIKFSASSITTGTTRTLTVPDASGTLPLLETANTFTQNQTLDGTNNVAPNQTAASGASLMTRALADARFIRWENSHEISNFTGATAGIVSGGSTTFGSGTTRLRGAASGAFRSIWSDYRGQLTGDVSALEAGAWRQRVIVGLVNDIRCLAGWYPVAGSLSAQWSGRGIGITTSGGVYPYFMYRDEAWRAMKSTQVRGSTSVFPVRASNVVTIETNGAHGLVAGDFVHVAGVLPQTMQTYRAEVTGVPTSTSFTYANTGADETGTTILGDNMNLAKIEELGSVATTGSSNLFTGTRTWDLAISVDGSGGATFYANGATVATGSGFRVAATANAARAGFGLQSLATATVISDLFIYKLEHTINP